MANPNPLFALEKFYEPVHLGGAFSVHAYKHPEHSISEMLHDTYFKNLIPLLNEGDHMLVVDTFGDVGWFKIEGIIRHQQRVQFSRAKKIPFETIPDGQKNDGYVVKWRGPRGGSWCICKLNGDPWAVDYRTRDEAERALELMREANDYAITDPKHRFKAAGDAVENEAA